MNFVIQLALVCTIFIGMSNGFGISNGLIARPAAKFTPLFRVIDDDDDDFQPTLVIEAPPVFRSYGRTSMRGIRPFFPEMKRSFAPVRGKAFEWI